MVVITPQEEGRITELDDLVLPDNDTVTGALLSSLYSGFDYLLIVSPDLVLIGTVTLEVLRDQSLDVVAANTVPYQPTPGTDLVIAQDKAVLVPTPGTHAFVLRSSATETNGPLTYKVYGLIRRGGA